MHPPIPGAFGFLLAGISGMSWVTALALPLLWACPHCAWGHCGHFSSVRWEPQGSQVRTQKRRLGFLLVAWAQDQKEAMIPNRDWVKGQVLELK